MDIIKRNLFAVILGVVVLIGTGVMIYLIVASNKELSDKGALVKQITDQEDAFKKSPYKLDRGSFDIAEANKAKIQAALKELQTGLKKNYTTLDFSNHQMRAVKFKENLANRSEVMHQLLTISGVTIPSNLTYFGFDHFLQSRVIPNHEQIAAVIKQLQIYDEMVDIISRSDVKQVDTWVFKGQATDPVPTKREVNNVALYQFFSYEMSVTGSVPALQKLLINLNKSGYCFVVRWMSIGSSMNSVDTIARSVGSGAVIRATPAPGTAPGGVDAAVDTAAAAGGSPKGERVIFTRFAPVHMNLAIDYIEFLD